MLVNIIRSATSAQSTAMKVFEGFRTNMQRLNSTYLCRVEVRHELRSALGTPLPPTSTALLRL